MRTTSTRIIGLAAAVAAAVAVTAPAAGAMPYSERAGDRPAPTVEVTGDALTPECAAWARQMSYGLALYGIYGSQADSYLASRADNPCATPLTLRSMFHAGDPGAA
jgi:hypothetical protein